jgi:tubulin polyglutamylase complex subunit 2
MTEIEFSEREALFDRIGFNILSYLHTFEEVCDVEFVGGEGISKYNYGVWERKNQQLFIPCDLKKFLELFNGVLLRWKIDIQEQQIVIGEIKVNSLENLDAIPLQNTSCLVHNDLSNFCKLSSADTLACYNLAFDCDGGIVALILKKGSKDDSEIWYVDEKKKWHFMCHTFTQYLRLALLHCGIIGWQMIFSPQGISMTTQQWMGMFTRERLCVYESARVAVKSY